MYMEIITAYLVDAKGRGFRQVLLWACPPPENGSLILYVHPFWQRGLASDPLSIW